MKEKLLVVIVGPTAVGKTTLCVDVAKHFETEILYADSRQFFKELAIGTAKPTPEEMQGVPHHFVDCMSVADEYSAGQFERDVLQKLDSLFQEKDIAILSGGSGLYVQAVCEGMNDLPPVDFSIRDAVINQYQEEGLSGLLEELKEKDPAHYDRVDRSNTQRIMRAVEVVRQTGKPFSSFRDLEKAERPFRILKIGLDRDREELYDRINLRMDLMLQQGLMNEVNSVMQFRDKNALQTVGYKEVFDFMDGLYDEEEMVRLLKRNSRRYAKRQLTWFRKDTNTHWFHPDELPQIIELIEATI
ncbi:tRNA (adenosine(37)-N6)-dimethylallyltransferase MiaA [Limibacter armeniacum]|uniref:tRNA (adenosine(37)-N6)-dimethylallyltransferase MiaA n=1 Tax=Limibacter armeniacum TaxID=466084 RepID=UPI002FE559BB